MNDYEEKMKQDLDNITKQKEEVDKRMLKLEIVMGYMSTITFIALVLVVSFIEMKNWIRVLLIVLGLTNFIIGIKNCIEIEQIAGYYECQKCHHKYVPKYLNVLCSMHLNRTRYMKCPNCNQKSWQKKVISKSEK